MIGTRRAFLGGPWSSAEWPLRFAASLVAAAAARPCSCKDYCNAVIGCHSLSSGTSRFILALADLGPLINPMTTAAYVHRMLIHFLLLLLVGCYCKDLLKAEDHTMTFIWHSVCAACSQGIAI